MIIHIWMHWFWITNVVIKSFFILAVQTISLSCISHLPVTEAGLLVNETFINQNFSFFNQNESSHMDNNPIITPLPIDIEKDKVQSHSLEITSHQLSPSSPFQEVSTETLEYESTSKLQDHIKISQESVNDMVDTYNGGSLDAFQYPLKKFTKYSHIKYGKVKVKSKPSTDESVTEEKKMESLKIVEEKVHINISIAGNDAGHVEPDIDKLNDTHIVVNSSEVLSSETTNLITTTPIAENSTSQINNASEFVNDTVLSEEEHGKNILIRPENETDVSLTLKNDFLEISNVTENQKEIQLPKNTSLIIENKVEESGILTKVEPFLLKNRVVAAAAAQSHTETNQSELNAGSITGITLGILVIFCLLGAVSFVLYRRRYLNKPQVLHDKCSNLDSSGYIDDTSLKENSEEMYSLDNDSFLNSLEAMTIQNYWTENVKHTKL